MNNKTMKKVERITTSHDPTSHTVKVSIYYWDNTVEYVNIPQEDFLTRLHINQGTE